MSQIVRRWKKDILRTFDSEIYFKVTTHRLPRNTLWEKCRQDWAKGKTDMLRTRDHRRIGRRKDERTGWLLQGANRARTKHIHVIMCKINNDCYIFFLYTYDTFGERSLCWTRLRINIIISDDVTPVGTHLKKSYVLFSDLLISRSLL